MKTELCVFVAETGGASVAPSLICNCDLPTPCRRGGRKERWKELMADLEPAPNRRHAEKKGRERRRGGNRADLTLVSINSVRLPHALSQGLGQKKEKS